MKSGADAPDPVNAWLKKKEAANAASFNQATFKLQAEDFPRSD
jgi:hypothetical protein